MSISSDEVNFLVYRYLQESGKCCLNETSQNCIQTYKLIQLLPSWQLIMTRRLLIDPKRTKISQRKYKSKQSPSLKSTRHLIYIA